jgi:hypothetical protein
MAVVIVLWPRRDMAWRGAVVPAVVAL